MSQAELAMMLTVQDARLKALLIPAELGSLAAVQFGLGPRRLSFVLVLACTIDGVEMPQEA